MLRKLFIISKKRSIRISWTHKTIRNRLVEINYRLGLIL